MLSQTVSGLAAQPLADGTGRGSGTRGRVRAATPKQRGTTAFLRAAEQ